MKHRHINVPQVRSVKDLERIIEEQLEEQSAAVAVDDNNILWSIMDWFADHDQAREDCYNYLKATGQFRDEYLKELFEEEEEA